MTVAVAITMLAVLRFPLPDGGASRAAMPGIEETATPLAPHVAFIGDSYVGGSDMGGYGASNFTRLWSAEMNWLPYIVDGIGGSGYQEGARQKIGPRNYGAPARSERLNAMVDLVFVINGVNDFKQPLAGTEPKAYQAYVSITKAAPKARVIAIGYIPLRGDTTQARKRNAALAVAARRAEITFWNPMDQGWLTGENARFIGSDRYHMTDVGHAHLARVLAQRSRAEGLDKIEHHTARRTSVPMGIGVA